MRTRLFRVLTSAGLLVSVAFAASEARLADAVMTHDSSAVQALLKAKADVNALQADGTSALHWAAHYNDLAAVQALLAAGANAKAANRYGTTPLAEAAAYADAAVTEALLKAGADPNTVATEEGQTVLMNAARTGNLGAVKLLVEHGANVNAAEDFRKQTALMWAAAEGHAPVIAYLLQHGANTELRSESRDTTQPHTLPAATPRPPIFRGGLTALVFAARQGQVDAVKALVDGGADINYGDIDGNTALIAAVLSKHFDLAKILIDRGADVNAANDAGRTALFSAVDVHDEDISPRPARLETDQLSSMDLIRLLVEHKANVNARLKKMAAIGKSAQDFGDINISAGGTAFMRAARSVDLDVMQYLLDHGADPKLANQDGTTALLLAAGVGYFERSKGTEEQVIEAVNMLMGLGLDVNAANEKGDTAVHGAVLRSADKLIQFLADHGADLNRKNKAEFTPLDLAMGKGGFGGGVRNPKLGAAALLRKLLETSPTGQSKDKLASD